MAAGLEEVVIVGMARTPIGSLSGSLSSVPATELGSIAIRGALERAGVEATAVDEVFMGNVLSAGVGQAPARQAALGAGCADTTPATTVNKVCASGMKAIAFGAQAIMLGQAEIVVAGGMESMSRCPYYMPDARGGMRYGHKQVMDGVVHDGLTDAYDNEPMGMAAEQCAEDHDIGREAQDAYAVESYQRALAAQEAGVFADEIVPVDIVGRRGTTTVSEDEEPGKFNADKFPTLRTVFKKDGTVTAGNASSINDGAAAVVLTSRTKAEEMGLTILATIKGFADAAKTPVEFTTAPSLAIPKALERAGVALEDVEFFEINEAFSVVACANNKLLGLGGDNVNVFGGGVSIGHPLGCSGARIIVTLLNVLAKKGATIGCAGICNGGGGASAMVIERPASE